MNKRAADIATLAGLMISLVTVCDMLGRFELPVLVWLDMAWGVACVAAMAVILLSSKARASFHGVAMEGSRLLWLRMLLAILLFLLGWYINGAMGNLYGEESAMVADNGQRMFAVIATAVAHVFYFAFTRRKLDV